MAEAQPKAQAEAIAPQPVRLEDYRPPDYLVDQVELRVPPGRRPTTEVAARLAVRRNPAAGEGARPLVLDGQELELLGLAARRRAARQQPLPGRRRSSDRARRPAGVHPREHGADPSRGEYRARGPLRLERRVLHPVRAGGLSQDHLLPGPAGRHGALPGADRGRSGRVSGPARERQPDRCGRAAGRPPFRALGGSRSPSPATCSPWSPAASPSSRTRFVTRSGRKVTLQIYTEPREIDKCAPRHGLAQEVDEVGRGSLRPRV